VTVNRQKKGGAEGGKNFKNGVRINFVIKFGKNLLFKFKIMNL
jgi:hypothetical protein